MTPLEIAHSWRQLEGFLARIPDPILRNSIQLELEKRAINQWGYCPSEQQLYKEVKEEKIPELNDLEQSIYDRIQAFAQYGVDLRTKEDKQKLYNETFNRMCQFVNQGGTYYEIPEDIRCDSIKEIYDKAFDLVFNINLKELING